MCGIVGVIAAKPTVKTRKIFKEMLFLDTLRGVHSTGLIVADKDKYVDYFKKAMQASDFLQLQHSKDLIEDLTNQVLIGHNRHATVGTVNDANAHPFQIGDLTGVHNGTLTTRWDLDDSAKFTVDSENLYHDMNNNGSEETLKKLNGAFTLVWVNSDKGTVHFVRNEERPLWMVASKDGEMLFFASEPWMFRVPCQRHDMELGNAYELKPGMELIIDIEKFPSDAAVTIEERELRPKTAWGNSNRGSNVTYSNNTKKTGSGGATNGGSAGNNNASNTSPAGSVIKRPKALQRGTLASFKIESGHVNKSISGQSLYSVSGFDKDGYFFKCLLDSETYKTCIRDKDKIKSLQAEFLYVSLPSTDVDSIPLHVLDGSNYIRLDYGGYISTIKNAGREIHEDNKPPSKDPKVLTLPVVETVKGYNGRLLSFTKFTELVSCGCANCSERVLFQEASDIRWLTHESFYCPECNELDILGKLD